MANGRDRGRRRARDAESSEIRMPQEEHEMTTTREGDSKCLFSYHCFKCWRLVTGWCVMGSGMFEQSGQLLTKQ